MLSKIRHFALIGFSLLLVSCGGSDSASLPAEPQTVEADEVISSIDDPLFQYQWYLDNTGQSALTDSNIGGTEGEDINIYHSGVFAQNFSGDGVKVVVVDTSLDIQHEDLLANVITDASFNFAENGRGQYDPTFVAGFDSSIEFDHGTSVAGLVAARGGNSIGLTGTAPSAELAAFNLLMNQDYPNELAALGHQPTLDSNDGYGGISSPFMDVFNMSYGRSITYVLPVAQQTYFDELISALKWGTQNLREGKGALYVKAAGNEFHGGWIINEESCQQASDMGVTCYNTSLERDISFPFELPVASFNANGHKSSFSSTGSSIWISGPGGESGVDSPALLSTDQSGCNAGYSQTEDGLATNDFDLGKTQENSDCHYFSAFNATSAAAPVVSGAIALLLEANPNLRWRDVKHILATTARKIDSNYAPVIMNFNGYDITLENSWVVNDAGYAFSNAFGFGALDVDAAITMATNNYQLLPALSEVEATGSVTNGGEIPDADANGMSETLMVNHTGNQIIESVQLTLSLSGIDGKDDGSSNFDFSDYQIILQSPTGTPSIIMTPFHAFDKQYNIEDLPLLTHAFYGEELNGSWTLIVRDLDSQSDLTGEGKLVNWSLKFYTHES